MRIAAVGSAFPKHYYDQKALSEALKSLLPERDDGYAHLEKFHRNVLVGGRYLALSLDAYAGLRSFGEANDAWIRVASEIGSEALLQALDRADLKPTDLDALFFVSVTGVATPSIDCHIMNRLALRSDVKRVPIFGLGCVAGAAGLARAADYVRAYPQQVAAVVAVELCSLTLQRGDHSVANLIATGLFGDGAAAALVTGNKRAVRGPRIVDSRSVFYPDTQDVMGWNISEKGFKVILSSRISEVVREHLRGDTDRFLSSHGLVREDIEKWICHAGGPRVLEAIQASLELPPDALEATWKSLARLGNLSSASVLLLLQEALDQPPPPGGHGLLLAMGPGFCSEQVLLRWTE